MDLGMASKETIFVFAKHLYLKLVDTLTDSDIKIDLTKIRVVQTQNLDAPHKELTGFKIFIDDTENAIPIRVAEFSDSSIDVLVYVLMKKIKEHVEKS